MESSRPGDALRSCAHVAVDAPVSIRVRPDGRAMREGVHAHGLPVVVSIRARPDGRAMPTDFDLGDTYTVVSIRARPDGRAMPGGHGGFGFMRAGFNPRPA